MPLNKQQLLQENNTNFPNNNSQLITPELLRQFNADMIDSMQLTQSMSEYAVLNGGNTFTGNQTITGNLNVTGVISASVLYVQTETASVIYSSGSNQFGDALDDTQILSGSVLIVGSGSINGQRILTTADTGSISFGTGSLVTTASFNAYTQSTNQRLTSLETNSASVNVSISNLNQTTASLNTSVTALNQFTQSQQALNGTFATTGSNTFTGNQIIDRASKLYTNGVYWTDMTAGFNNLEIINQGGGNLDFASLNGGRMRVVNTPLQLTGSILSSNSDISTSANIYAANLTGSGVVPAGTISSSAQITALGFVSSSVTASSLITASADGGTITFTKGDNTQFSVTIATGSVTFAETASLATSALDIIVNVKNTTGAQINKGTVVRIIGATGDNPLIGTASWTDDDNSANTLGFVVANIANDAFGRVMTQGTLLNVNTDPALGYVAGQLVYLSGSGQYTNVKPDAPFHEVRLGQVLRAQQNNGSIYVLVQNGYELDELHDVDINTGSLANNDLLAWDSASQQWTNKTVSGVGATTTASFNAYTSSTNSRLTNIESTTASLNSSVSQLNASSASQQISINNLNTTTASLLIETQNLELFSASVLISISNLNTATASLFTSASSALVTASFDNATRNLTFTKGNNTTFAVNIPDVSGSTINTGSFATTGSNSFNGSQIITGSVTSSADILIGDTPFGTSNRPGTAQVAIGIGALQNATGGANNIAIGNSALQANTTGDGNIAIGVNAAAAGVHNNNTYVGFGAAQSGAGTSANHFNSTGIGRSALANNIGAQNTAVGAFAGNSFSLSTSGNITLIGADAGRSLTNGAGNTLIGAGAGQDITTGSNNTLIGRYRGVAGLTDSIVLSDGNANIRAQFINNEWDLTGSVDISGSLTASLAQGFTYVGNASGRTIAVSTSSFASTINTGSFATTGSNAFFGTNSFSGAVSFTGSAPSILSSSFSGSLITNLTDIYTDIPAVQQIVTLSSASYAALASGSLTNPNTLYIVSGSLSGSGGGGTTDITSLNAFTASQFVSNSFFATTGSNTFIGAQTFNVGLQKVTITDGSNADVLIEPTANESRLIIKNNDKGVLRFNASAQTLNQIYDITIDGAGNTGSLYIGTADQGFTYAKYSDNGLTTLYNKVDLSGSLNITGSISASLPQGFVLVGDASNRTALVATSSFGGGTIPAGTISSSAQITELGFVSSSITASSLVTASVNLNTITFTKGDASTFSLTVDTGSGGGGGTPISVQDEGTILGNATSFNFNGAGVTATLTAGTASITIPGGGGSIDTGSFATTGSNTFTGDQTFIDAGGNFFTITDTSGSLMLVGKSYTSASAHLSSSVPSPSGSLVNFIFKSNNTTADTIISGSNNIFTNPATATAGFKRYLTANNIAIGGGFPQLSGSVAFSPAVSNNYFAGTLTMRLPVSASLFQVSANNLLGTLNVGQTAILNAEKLTGQTALSQNIIAGQFNLIANQSEIRSLSNITQNNINGVVALNLSSSAVAFSQNTINDSSFTFTNQFSSGAVGIGQPSIVANTIGGSGNIFFVTGSQPVASTNQANISSNIVIGNSNTIFVNSSESRVSGTTIYHQASATGLIGNRLVVTGSSHINGDTNSYGSLFVGRYNAVDGIRNKTSDIVFAVGTGNSGTRKTGFLIDSGSNSYFEGAVNISGSLLLNGSSVGGIATGSFATTGSNSFDGNQKITGSLTMSGSIVFVDRSGNDTNTYLGLNALGMGFAGAQPLAEGNTIAIAIGNGAMRFASGSNQNVAIGNNALLITTGSKNFAMGSEALSSNTTGQSNIAIGTSALTKNTTGELNTVIGDSAGFNASGSYNTLIGQYSGYNLTGSFNTILGSYQSTAGTILNNNIVLADGQGNVKAQYSGSAWSFQDEIKLNKGSNKPADIVSVGSGGTTVNNSLVTAASIILVTTQNGVVGTDEYPAVVTSKTNGSFVIQHNYGGGNLDVAYLIINPTA